MDFFIITAITACISILCVIAWVIMIFTDKNK